MVGGAESVSDKREYRYVGPQHQLPKATQYCPLSSENALGVIQRAWNEGRIHSGTHFKQRCSERNIDFVDVEHVISRGKIVGNGEHCVAYDNWKYCVGGVVEDRLLHVIIALDPSEDLSEMPIGILITVYEKKQPRLSP